MVWIKTRQWTPNDFKLTDLSELYYKYVLVLKHLVRAVVKSEYNKQYNACIDLFHVSGSVSVSALRMRINNVTS